MSENRKDDGFNLAFLDVMACGLGAVLLILILVKFNANSDDPSQENEKLKEELVALQGQTQQVSKDISSTEEAIVIEVATIQAVKVKIKNLKVEQDNTRRALKDKIAVLANLEDAAAAAAKKQADNTISLSGRGEESYLIGLKVEGSHIGILLDTSASMTAETIIEGIKIKIGSESKKKSGAKWVRSIRIVKWLLARLPKESKVSIVSYNDKAKTLGMRPTNSAKNSSSIKALVTEVDKLVPTNGTNLQVGLKEIKKSMPNMTDLYVITDGLPTLGENSGGLLSYAKCGSFFGKSQTINGQCRINLFNHTIGTTSPANVKTHIILLPLEGDPDAPFFYWTWASKTGGTFISPASTWP
jgi:hypothetical protein